MSMKKLTLSKETLQRLGDVTGVVGGYTTLLDTEATCNPSGNVQCKPIPTYFPCPGGAESLDTCAVSNHRTC